MKRTLALSLVVALSLFGFACAREEHTDITTDTGGDSTILSETSSTISTTTPAPMTDDGTAATDTTFPTTTDAATTTDTSTTDVTTTQPETPTP